MTHNVQHSGFPGVQAVGDDRPQFDGNRRSATAVSDSDVTQLTFSFVNAALTQQPSRTLRDYPTQHANMNVRFDDEEGKQQSKLTLHFFFVSHK